MKALVTGASGFIGSHIVEALEAAGHQVFALVRATSNTSHLKKTRAELLVGDITDRDSLDRACRGMDWVFHTASVVAFWAPWRLFYEVGVQGTRNLVEAAAGASVFRFIHFSSMVVYGTSTRGRTYTEDMPLEKNPERWNHYVREKVLSEQIVQEANDAGRICATIFRPSIVIGTRDRSLEPWLRLLRSPLACTVDEGNNRMPFVVVEEVAEICVKAAQLKVAEGRCYNLSGRQEIRQREVYKIFTEVAGVPTPRLRLPKTLVLVSAAILENLWSLFGASEEPLISRFGFRLATEDWDIDCSRARQELGWVGSSDYKDAIERYVRERASRHPADR